MKPLTGCIAPGAPLHAGQINLKCATQKHRRRKISHSKRLIVYQRKCVVVCAEMKQAASEDGVARYEPLEGRYNYRMLKALPVAQLKFELTRRNLPDYGMRMQMAGRLYQALLDEGRGLTAADEPEEGSFGEDAESWVSEEERAASESALHACQANPLMRLQSSRTGWMLDVGGDEEPLICNSTGMQVTFLHTVTAPNGIPAATSAALRTLQSVWLFECGEDTQRTLSGHRLIDWKRIERIFVGSMSPEAVLGLPGMLCTISASRERGHESADFPVHVYGPPGLVQFVSSMLSVSRTYLEMPVVLHEFTPRAVPADHLGLPVEVLRRSRLYAVQLPPDQLNPEGYYDGTLARMLSRHVRKRTGTRLDSRSGTMPQALPGPGDPSRTDVAIADMTWTVRADGEWTVQAVPLKSKGPCLGFIAQEADRAGRLFPEVAVALGVPHRDLFADLKDGKAVEAADGTLVRPEQCVGPPRRGRRIAIVPPCEDSAVLAGRAGGVDLVVHSMLPPLSAAAMGGPGGREAALSAARVAGRSAAVMQAPELVLWQPFTSFLDSSEAADPDFPRRLLEEARGAYGGSHVALAGSFALHSWGRNSGEGGPPELPPELEHLLDGPARGSGVASR